jgi:hypothetical protein
MSYVENKAEQDRLQMTIWRMSIACWIPKATNTHSQYVILIAFPGQGWLHKRASLARYTYIACLVNRCVGMHFCILVKQTLFKRGTQVSVYCHPSTKINQNFQWWDMWANRRGLILYTLLKELIKITFTHAYTLFIVFVNYNNASNTDMYIILTKKTPKSESLRSRKEGS